MTKVYIKTEQHCLHHYREDVEWGEWSTEYEFSVEGASLRGGEWFSGEDI